jgi:lysozyme
MNERLKDILGRHEGKRRFPYDDADGRQIGPGKRTIRGHLTIGKGRNLEDVGLSDDEIEHLFENDIRRAVAGAKRLIRNFDALSENRQIVVTSLVYMMGEAGFAAWTDTRGHIEAGRFGEAARHIERSKMYAQLGGDPPGTDDGRRERPEELARMMREG